jgi:probable F420-dependent oxidoreductase
LVEFGVRLPVGGSIPSVEGISKIALESERLEYNFVSARENIHWPAEQQLAHISEGARDVMDEKSYIPVHYDPTVVFSYLAPLTQKLKFVYAIAQLVYKHPAVWAKQIATLDVMSNGRVVFGIAPGGYQSQFKAFGIPYDKRGAITDETFCAIRELWTKPSASFSGRFIQFSGIVEYPKPLQKPYPPVLFAGQAKPAIIKRVAEYCDGWFPYSLTTQEISEGKRQIAERAEENGRGSKEFSVYFHVSTRIGKTDEEAWNESKMTVLADDRNKERDPSFILDRNLIGSVDTIIEQIERYNKAGVTHYELLFIYFTIEDLIKQMNIMTSEVIPSFTRE